VLTSPVRARNQPSARPDQRQIRLRLHAAVLHRIQQLRIDPGQPRQRLRIQTIVLLAALPDQPHLARIGDDHFMTQLAEQAADPGRMRPDFQCDPTARYDAEDFAQRFRICPHALLQLYLAGFLQHAVPAIAISQIQSDGQFLLRNIPALLCRYGANLLHCRSPFYLCFEHVDNLGAYTASRRRPAFSSHLLASTINYAPK